MASLVAVKATCTIFRSRGREVLCSDEWLALGRNREDMRLKLWRGIELRDHTPRVIAAHDGQVWSVALSDKFLVSAGDEENILQKSY